MSAAAVTPRSTLVDEEVVAERMAFVDGAMGAAGHQVTDPAVRSLVERVARNEMTGDQAVEALRHHVQG